MLPYLERERFNAIKRENRRAARQLLEDGEQAELEREIEANLNRGWGDFRTWMWVGAFILLTVVIAALSFTLGGTGWQTHWHIGYPPTGPG